MPTGSLGLDLLAEVSMQNEAGPKYRDSADRIGSRKLGVLFFLFPPCPVWAPRSLLARRLGHPFVSWICGQDNPISHFFQEHLPTHVVPRLWYGFPSRRNSPQSPCVLARWDLSVKIRIKYSSRKKIDARKSGERVMGFGAAADASRLHWQSPF